VAVNSGWTFKGGLRRVKILHSYFLRNGLIQCSTNDLELQRENIEGLVTQKSPFFFQFLREVFSLNNLTENSITSDEIGRLIIDFCDRNMVPASRFSWITIDDRRLLFYIWGLLKISYFTHIENPKNYYVNFEFNRDQVHPNYACTNMPMGLRPSSPSEIRSSIIEYFDLSPCQHRR
jgi:hypothetical protein